MSKESSGKNDPVAIALWGIFALFYIAFLAMIVIPNYLDLREKARIAAPPSKSVRDVKPAAEVWYCEKGRIVYGYTSNLSALLSYDRGLTDDGSVTFTFGPVNTSGYR